ncbi:uncharacterized protein F54H12.2 [Trichonephila clavipes]|uniref:Uncharacterized protein F54H12.2 n=1 Tax=Trichonephila clavipes TaxID=2585209 RepID=A0A8X7BDY7_TRICX|nr:uncharacterized protein F54H12.2 [Trichonephila clavipes]
MHQDLAAFYENPEVPNSFGGVEALHRSVKGKYSKKDVKHWLSLKDAYTLHKPVRHKFQRNRVFVSDIDRQREFQADLVDMQSLAEFNKGYKYLLTCIDLFSKFAWAVPLKDKFGKSVKSGLEIIFKERKPKVLQTDAENKISNFKTQLPSPVCLNGEWEVGLSEIIYPHSWLNVNETNNYFLYKVGDGNISSTVKRTIDVGCYETMLDIISAVQLALPKNPNRFTIIYNKATKRVKINAVQGSSLHLENLGEFFYVYSDLISPQIVGDTQAPLLRIVRTKDKDGETISQYYDKPQYLPLVRHSFQTIQSELRLNSGDFVPFERGQIGSGLTHYKGINFQKGYGIGGIFRRLFRAALPFLVKGEAVKTRSKESGKKLAQKAIDRVQSMVGKGQYKRKLDVSLNDRVASSSTNTYPYRSYIETLLNHGYDSKTSQLTAELFYKDSDDGLKKRTEFFKESATVDMIGFIHSDLFHQDRLLLNLVDLKIKLILSKPEFCLQGSEGFKVVLDHVSLFIRKVRVNRGVILGHAKALEKTSAKYPINRALCKVYSIPKESMSFIQDNIFSGQMPKTLFVGCVDNEAFHGAFSKSPYEFKHFNLNFIGVYVDGQPVPHNPLELDFSKDQYIRAYQTLFVGTDRMGQDRGIFISRKRI